MSLDLDLVSILVCPKSGVGLRIATAQEVKSMNELIDEKKVINQGGQVIESTVDLLLVTVDGHRAFQVNQGIPNMIFDESIELSRE